MKIFNTVFLALAAVAVLAFGAQFTEAGQNFAQYVAQQLNTGSATYLQTDSQGALLTASGASTALNQTASSVIQVGPGRVASINVIVAGSAGALYDAATTGAATAANEMAVVPAAVGRVTVDMPFTNGLVYAPGASQVAAVTYNK